jgi:hypothetical protein
VREHPELCTYHPPAESHPPAKRPQLSSTTSLSGDIPNGMVDYAAGTVTLSRADWDHICAKLVNAERILAESKHSIQRQPDEDPFQNSTDLPRNGFAGTMIDPDLIRAPIDNETRHESTQGVHTRNEMTGEVVHVGGSSVPALIMALGRGDHDNPGVREVLGKKSILPIFGLDNESATYPFVDLWGIPHGSILRATELSNALPNDQECLNFFRYYKETAQVVFPAIAEPAKFEEDLLLFLLSRANIQNQGQEANGITEQSIYGKNLHWIGLLFASLASGCQCSALPRKERELTSQVYICCSFECLRFTNFLSQPTLETIQTLLILSNVISNNMNAGVAWALLGLTIRLSQILGLHRRCPDSTPYETKRLRSSIWWSVLWQENLLSITFDRPTSIPNIDHPMPPGTNKASGEQEYAACMYRLCRCGLEILRERSTQSQNSNEALQRITEHRNELQKVMMDAADYLKDSRRCRSMRDQLEHWALYLHMSYVTSELCRPAISPATAGLDLTMTLRQTCIDALTNTVEAFLGLQNMTAFASRSWAALHRAISSALLLSILGEPGRNERARTLVINLVTVLTEITSKLDPAEQSAPITRSIAALQKLINLAENQYQRNLEAGSTNSASQLIANNVDEISSITFDDPTYGSASPFSDLDLEQSPYTLMDTIIWGNKRSPTYNVNG